MSQARKPKFKVGQVVSVKSFYANFSPGEVGPGFKGKRGWRHGFQFGKIVKISAPTKNMKRTAPFCYFLDGWPSALTEDDLRKLSVRDIAND